MTGKNDRNGYSAAEELEAFVAARLAGEQVTPPADVIDTGLVTDLVDLAESMQPDPGFVAALEANLCESYERRAASQRSQTTNVGHPPSTLLTYWQKFKQLFRRQIMHKRTIFTLAGVAILILLGLFGPAALSELGSGPAPVSAAEILLRADATLAASLDENTILYDRLSLDWQTGLTTGRNTVVELWQAPEGNKFRYQITDADGNLLYFVQRDGDRVWRSVHTQPVGAESVTKVYTLSLEAYRAELSVDASPWLLFYNDLSTGWTALDRLMADRSAVCDDLSCLFSVPDGEWACGKGVEGEVCTLSLDGAPMLQARRMGEEKLADGRTVQVVQIDLGEDWTRTLKVDAETFALVEIADRAQGEPVARLRHLERRPLTEALVDDGLFGAVPQNLEVVLANQTEAGTDRVWIVSALPEPGEALRGRTEFEVVVGYELASAPEGALKVDLARPGWETVEEGRLPIVKGTEFVEVMAGKDEVTLHFTVNPAEEAWLEPGDLALMVTLGTWEGATRFNTLAAETFVDYVWRLEP